MRIKEDQSFGDRECPSCACRVPANNNSCPICGYAFPQERPLKKRLRIFIAVAMLVLFLILVLRLF